MRTLQRSKLAKASCAGEGQVRGVTVVRITDSGYQEHREMDGQRVKEWEARCIEEQPPACTTACPLRVDVRGMLAKMKTGDFAGACAIYARVIPFPAILSRICDHPCEAACRSAEAGGAIRIAALEKRLRRERLRQHSPRAPDQPQGQARRRRRRRACGADRRVRPRDERTRRHGFRSRARVRLSG